jgi:hypothetical protein
LAANLDDRLSKSVTATCEATGVYDIDINDYAWGQCYKTF